tara:strand:- start:78 stop:950 length:873 start_codon:yes stop_codon:yes gene_type:complete
MGGIGDQIFQYCYANYLKNKLNCQVYLDISYYSNKLNYNKFIFRLNNISKKNKFILKKNISYLNWNLISYLRYIEIFKINKIFTLIYYKFFKLPVNFFIYEYWKNKKKSLIKKNSYYFGYWHNLKYVKNIKLDLNKNLINNVLNKKNLKKFIEKINNKTVAIHIRGGDFKNLSSHNILGISYYEKSIKFYKSFLKNAKFHIFTNDIKFSKEIISKILKKNEFIYVKKFKFCDIEEFSLFSKYRYAILANSTFSLMSSYLSSERKISVGPKIWFKGEQLDNRKKFSKLKFL